MKIRKNQIILTILIINLIYLTIVSSLSTVYQGYSFQTTIGDWSDTVTPILQADSYTLPQYFLCGWAFRQMSVEVIQSTAIGWTKKNVIIQTNAFKGIYCHYQNWDDQTAELFQTGNKQSKNWTSTMMCPKGKYINKITGQTGFYQNINMGLVGLSAGCDDTNLFGSTAVQNDNPITTGEVSKNLASRFVSGLDIKYINRGFLTGFYAYFEGMPSISKVSVTYQKIVSSSPLYAVIDTLQFSNNKSQPIQASNQFSKRYWVPYIWTLKNMFIYGYNIKQNLKVDCPQLMKPVGNAPYQSVKREFKFGRLLSTLYDPNREMLAAVSPCSKVTAKSTIREQNMTLPYTVVIQYVDIITGASISNQTQVGSWVGIATSGVNLQISSSQLAGCTIKKSS